MKSKKIIFGLTTFVGATALVSPLCSCATTQATNGELKILNAPIPNPSYIYIFVDDDDYPIGLTTDIDRVEDFDIQEDKNIKIYSFDENYIVDGISRIKVGKDGDDLIPGTDYTNILYDGATGTTSFVLKSGGIQKAFNRGKNLWITPNVVSTKRVQVTEAVDDRTAIKSNAGFETPNYAGEWNGQIYLKDSYIETYEFDEENPIGIVSGQTKYIPDEKDAEGNIIKHDYSFVVNNDDQLGPVCDISIHAREYKDGKIVSRGVTNTIQVLPKLNNLDKPDVVLDLEVNSHGANIVTEEKIIDVVDTDKSAKIMVPSIITSHGKRIAAKDAQEDITKAYWKNASGEVVGNPLTVSITEEMGNSNFEVSWDSRPQDATTISIDSAIAPIEYKDGPTAFSHDKWENVFFWRDWAVTNGFDSDKAYELFLSVYDCSTDRPEVLLQAKRKLVWDGVEHSVSVVSYNQFDLTDDDELVGPEKNGRKDLYTFMFDDLLTDKNGNVVTKDYADDDTVDMNENCWVKWESHFLAEDTPQSCALRSWLNSSDFLNKFEKGFVDGVQHSIQQRFMKVHEEAAVGNFINDRFFIPTAWQIGSTYHDGDDEPFNTEKGAEKFKTFSNLETDGKSIRRQFHGVNKSSNSIYWVSSPSTDDTWVPFTTWDTVTVDENGAFDHCDIDHEKAILLSFCI